MKLIKPVAKFTLVTQLLFPLLYSASSVASAVNTKQEKASHREVLAKIQSNLPELTSKQTDETHSMTGDELLAQGLSKSAQIINGDNRLDAVENLAQSTAFGLASKQMTNWLNQYGNATIQISSDKSFSGEYFLPFYETEDNLFFSQSRIQRQDEDRTTLNLGLGYRYFMPDSMWGVNSFYDRDLKNNHARLGLGAEFGADYIKLAANSYFRLTDWRESRLSAFHDYDERPANGFDIRAEGFLPSYPQLGANLKYEKYFGKKVNLKGSNSISNLKKDPQAYTVGISYTPVPLLSFSLNQSMGDVNQTKGELAVNYRIGVPLSQQLDTDLVPQMRTLMGARYNPVDRNNTIVMQYQKQELLRIDFDKTLHEINSLQSATITPTIHKNKYDVKHVVYMSHDGLFDGKNTHTSKTADHSAVFTAPEFNSKSRSASNNTYEVYAYAEDVKGNRSNTVKLMVKVVNVIDVSKKEQAEITTNKNTLTAGGDVTLTVDLKDKDGNSVSDKTVSVFREDANGKIYPVSTLEKGDDGKYKFTDTSNESGKYTYKFKVNDVLAASSVIVEYTPKTDDDKQELLTVSFYKSLYEVNSLEEVTITPFISKSGAAKVVYNNSKGLFSGENSMKSSSDNHSITFKVPAYDSSQADNNIYEVEAYAVDLNGNKLSNIARFNVKVVNAIDLNDENRVKITSDLSTQTAGNNVIFAVDLKDVKGNSVSDKTVKLYRVNDKNMEYLVGTVDKGDDGKYFFTDTAESGKYTYKFKVNGVLAESSVHVEYIPKKDDDKQELLTVSFYKSLYEVNSLEEVTITPFISKSGAAKVVYNNSKGLFSGENSKDSSSDNHSITFRVPAYNSAQLDLNIYEVEAYAVDLNGKKLSNIATFNVKVVNAIDLNDENRVKITSDSETQTAGHNVIFTVDLKDVKGNSVSDKTVKLYRVNDKNMEYLIGTVDKGEDGKYYFTNTAETGKYTYTFKVNGVPAKSTVGVEFTPNSNGNGGSSSGGGDGGNGGNSGSGDGGSGGGEKYKVTWTGSSLVVNGTEYFKDVELRIPKEMVGTYVRFRITDIFDESRVYESRMLLERLATDITESVYRYYRDDHVNDYMQVKPDKYHTYSVWWSTNKNTKWEMILMNPSDLKDYTCDLGKGPGSCTVG